MTASTSHLPIIVRIDERVRVLGAALAGTDLHEREHKEGLGKAHYVAEQADEWIAPLRDHPCCAALQRMLDHGAPLSGLHAYVLGLTPDMRPDRRTTGFLRAPLEGLEGDSLAVHLARFRGDARLDELWEKTRTHWDFAIEDARKVLAQTQVSEYLSQWFGNTRQPVFIPNLLYPALTPLGIAAHGDAICICPPPKAWGTSKPWNYGDDVEWTRQVTFRECCRATLRGLPWRHTITAALIDLLATALTIHFLRATGDEPGARELQLMDTKRRGLKELPFMVTNLVTYVSDRAAGRHGDPVAVLEAALADTMRAQG